MEGSAKLADQSRSVDCDNLTQIRLPESAHCYGGERNDLEASNLETGTKVSMLKKPWKMQAVTQKNKRFRILASDEDLVDDDRYDRLESMKLEKHPQGLPRTAVWLDSDPDNGLYRRFGVLHARSLLHKQTELTLLEAKLEKMDRDDAAGDESWKLNSYPILGDAEGDDRPRAELMAEIDMKMKEYDKLLLRAYRLSMMRRPTKRLHRFLFNYFWNERPVPEGEMGFVYKKDDFVALTDHPEFGWFDDILSKLMDRSFLKSIFVTPEDQAKTNNPYIIYYSKSRLGSIVSTLIAFLSTILLLIPVYILITTRLSMPVMATIVLTFVLLFAICVSVFTGARRHEVFAATAAYCAVLVVFLGNLQQLQQANGDKLPKAG